MSDNSDQKKITEQKSKGLKRGHCAIKKSEIECKTPPLTGAVAQSIEELIRQRKNLKEELEKLTRKIDEKKSKKQKLTSITSMIKKQQDINAQLCKISVVKEDLTDPNDDYDLDSENEDIIIYQRREKRRQLMEKLNPTPGHCELNHRSAHENIAVQNKSMESHNIYTVKEKQAKKEIPDMFSESDIFQNSTVTSKISISAKKYSGLTDNWDDNEGYYKVVPGDIVNGKYVLNNILGQGVFANVVQANYMQSNSTVAVKIIRQNDMIYHTSLKEVNFLKQIRDADHRGKYHCIRFLESFRHKGHLCIVLELFHMNLRSALKMCGKNQGLKLRTVRSYSMQLLIALRFLKRLGIIHCDIKPDNILLNERSNIVKLCDFGSASTVETNEVTPYLVSRFYRAPEIILGFPYGHGVDIWSTACTIYEMATGKILFTGSTNNKMLKAMIDTKGKFPVKMVRRGRFKDLHFNSSNNFLLHQIHERTGLENSVEIMTDKPVRDFLHKLKSCAGDSIKSDKKLYQLKDLLDKMTMIDPKLRYSATDAYNHPFIQDIK